MEKKFFSFIKERQKIWFKRFVLKESGPWTKDYVLQKYKIINVYRELDKGTDYIIKKLNGLDRKKIFLNVVFYRFFNQYNLYEKLKIQLFEKLPLMELSEKFEKSNGPIFNSAYIISSQKGCKWRNVLNSIKQVSDNIDSYLSGIDNAKTPDESFEVIKNIKLVGDFLAYEIWTDLTYFNFFKQGWSDDDFVNIGPGAKWGLELIYGKLPKKELEQKIYYLRKIQKDYLVGEEWKKIAYKNSNCYPFLSIRNIEHSLCEFRKYWNISKGVGRRKNFSPISKPKDL
jgi:hypothetical protein